jgi:DNA-binding response OmpR family regulator
VLVVEDEEAVGEGIQALFALEGVCVDIVSTGAEAIPAIERFAPDAVVLDIGLPDIDGSELYVQIAARWPCLPVVFSSGHADETKLEQYLARPMVELLVKPYAFESLRETIAKLVLSARPSPSSSPATAPPPTPRCESDRQFPAA